MAHGFDCKRCGYCESAHDFPDDYAGVCAAYVSPDQKAETEMWRILQEQDSEYENNKRRKSGIPDGL